MCPCTRKALSGFHTKGTECTDNSYEQNYKYTILMSIHIESR